MLEIVVFFFGPLIIGLGSISISIILIVQLILVFTGKRQ